MFGIEILTPGLFALSCAFAFFAGTIKGVVGFAMPMIMISSLGSFLPAELAIAALIGPTVATNYKQALRQGGGAAWDSIVHHRRYLITGAVLLVLSAQLVGWLDGRLVLLMIGVPIVLYALTQLAGWVLILEPRQKPAAELGFGVVSGFFGGLSGVWGPPMVMYLTALQTPKQEQVRVQGVAFGLGGILLLLAHLQSGVVNAQTGPFSLALCVPALLGMWLGLRLQDNLDQALFRRITLLVLTVAGLNLVRRALMG